MAKQNGKSQDNKQQPAKKDTAKATVTQAQAGKPATATTIGEKKEVIKQTSNSNPQSRIAILVGIALLIIAGIIGLALLLNSRNQNTGNDNNQPVSGTGAVTVEDKNNSSSSSGNINGEGASTDKNNNGSTSNNSNNSSNSGTNTGTNTNTNSGSSNTNTATGNTTAPQQSSTSSSETSSSTAALKTGHSQAGYDKSLAVQKRINENGVWEATQYTKGDILSGPYTVQKGDTLWQIANGFYGDPFQWHKIENANFGSIGYLPNGEHALIWPNQVLSLP